MGVSLSTMASAIAAISAANASKARQQKLPTGDPDRFQPARQLRLVKRDEDGEIIEVPFWPSAQGDSCLEKVRSFCWNFYEYPEDSWLCHWINVFIMGCIVLSALVMVIESIPGIHKKNTQYWEAIESFFVVAFSTEFLMRVFGTPSQRQFWTSGMNWIDLLSILPWYLNILVPNASNLAALRILRLGRSLRLVKLSRYSSGVRLIIVSLEQSMDALYLFLFILIILVIVCSSAVYYTERGTYDSATETYMREDPIRGYLCCPGNSSAPCEAGTVDWAYPDSANFTCTQTNERSPFQSIPESFWWCCVTLTTVGYGDSFPVTHMGQAMGMFTMLLGIITLALPISIIGGSFIDERSQMMDRESAEELRSRNTVPKTADTEAAELLFPVKRVENSLEGMDYCEAELTRASKKCEVAVLGLIKLQDRFVAKRSDHCANTTDPEALILSCHTMKAMELLVESFQESIVNISSHLD